MSKSTKKAADQAEREKVHKRYSNRREPDVIYPARKQVDFYDADVHQRVAVYVRVSTDNLGQETSYELQKNYYEEFVLKHPNWSLVKIYADKGISGTSTKHRVALNQMLADSRAGKIDLIITKSVSRLARNTVDCITMVRNLAELRNPVGVFFESECIFSLNEDTSMPLSFLASIAENESRIRSRSMEVSLAQRLNGGLPLTPKLLGYSHDTDGKLVINPDEAPTVKLIFYMYLSGYSSAYIAKTLEELGKTTFLGNTKWTSNTVIQILRNERHCGDVLTRKTWTPDVISHKSQDYTFTLHTEPQSSHTFSVRYTDGTEIDGTALDDGYSCSIHYANGDTYSGLIVSGMRNGEGTYTWSSGEVFSGEWKDDCFTGNGTFTFADGSVLKGTFLDNQFTDGTAAMHVNSAEYVYGVENGQIKDPITVTLADGTKYSGTYTDNRLTGSGSVSFSDGDTYVGTIEDGKKSGYGTYTWADRDWYEGAWADDKMNGSGVYYFSY